MEDRVCAGEARAAGGKTGHENGAASRCRPSTIVGVLCEVDLRRPVGQRVCSLTMSNGDEMPRMLRIAVACNTELAGCRTLECCNDPLPKIVVDYVAKHSLIAVKAYGCTRYCW